MCHLKVTSVQSIFNIMLTLTLSPLKLFSAIINVLSLSDPKFFAGLKGLKHTSNVMCVNTVFIVIFYNLIFLA